MKINVVSNSTALLAEGVLDKSFIIEPSVLNLSDRPVKCREAFDPRGEAVADGLVPCGGRGIVG